MTLEEKIMEILYSELNVAVYDEYSASIDGREDAAKRIGQEIVPIVTGWQPIETAPRDGTPVLLWPCKFDGLVICVAGYWDADAWTDCVEGAFPIEATHWMPLPPTPST